MSGPELFHLHKDLNACVEAWKRDGARVAFVPTMGALHDGHLSLVRMARQLGERCVVSIFVNPTQFAPHEDLEAYPRSLEADIALLAELGVDCVYAPAVEEIYPSGTTDQRVDALLGQAASGLESDFRPHFFDGVVNVVGRLFDHVQPDLAVFGEKDYQQLCVVRDVFSDVEIISAPIVRDPYGLALSSRNAYLSDEQLRVARMLNVVLFQLADMIRDFPNEAYDLLPTGIQTLLDAGLDEIDYLELRTGKTLEPLDAWNQKPARLLVAGLIGSTRLIDNVSVV